MRHATLCFGAEPKAPSSRVARNVIGRSNCFADESLAQSRDCKERTSPDRESEPAKLADGHDKTIDPASHSTPRPFGPFTDQGSGRSRFVPASTSSAATPAARFRSRDSRRPAARSARRSAPAHPGTAPDSSAVPADSFSSPLVHQ